MFSLFPSNIRDNYIKILDIYLVNSNTISSRLENLININN